MDLNSRRIRLKGKELNSGLYKDLKYCYAKSEDQVLLEAEFSPVGSDAVERYGVEGRELPCEGEYIPELTLTVEDAQIGHIKDLWKNFKFVSCYRARPEQIHGGDTFATFDWKTDGLHFDAEGADVVEFLTRFGQRFVIGAVERGQSECNVCYPGVEDRYLISQVNAWLQVVSPGSSVIVEDVSLGDSNKCILSVAYANDDGVMHRFKPQNVGFGISYVLPALVALLTSGRDDIVVIENPEAHLHPKGQYKMGELLARAAASGVQVFVETHSDHVVNGVRGAVKDKIVSRKDVGISYFERKVYEDEVCTDVRNIKIDSHGSLSEYPEGFMDEWNNQLMELI